MHHTYDDLQKRWKSLRGQSDLTVREVACGMGARTLLCAEIGDALAPAVTISAGMHGDEPAGTVALFELAQHQELPSGFRYRLWPCINPTGYDAGTRESAGGVDLNRTFARGGSAPESRAILTANRDLQFELALDLHEDCDMPGFYCYEYGSRELGNAVVDALAANGMPLATEPVLRPDPKEEELAIGGRSYTLALARRAARSALTLETPGGIDRERRAAILRIAVKAAIDALSKITNHG